MSAVCGPRQAMSEGRILSREGMDTVIETRHFARSEPDVPDHRGRGTGETEVVEGRPFVDMAALGSSDAEQGLDRSTFVHRRVGLDDAIQVGREVEDATGVDGPLQDVGQEFGNVSPHR